MLSAGGWAAERAATWHSARETPRPGRSQIKLTRCRVLSRKQANSGDDMAGRKLQNRGIALHSFPLI